MGRGRWSCGGVVPAAVPSPPLSLFVIKIKRHMRTSGVLPVKIRFGLEMINRFTKIYILKKRRRKSEDACIFLQLCCVSEVKKRTQTSRPSLYLRAPQSFCGKGNPEHILGEPCPNL
jgi:hypothetical protein